MFRNFLVFIGGGIRAVFRYLLSGWVYKIIGTDFPYGTLAVNVIGCFVKVFVERAKEFGMAGATVLRGVESYGAGSRIHTAKLLELSEDLPLVIEIVDTEEKVDTFLPVVEEIFEKAGCGGMVTEEKATVIHYTPGKTP
ncbi:MAG: DUF190 domain-containing protein [Bacteroidetes bacterium]|nr:DUF190 domain-containing protein [Bacteroidota bacterium]MCL5737822.1 DUF190 domain-containing protein [Bacteroidota bacterium]